LIVDLDSAVEITWGIKIPSVVKVDVLLGWWGLRTTVGARGWRAYLLTSLIMSFFLLDQALFAEGLSLVSTAAYSWLT
jgi:hypothetical protein